MRGLRERLADERGSTIVLAVVSLTGLLAASALAVDVGMLFTARSEAQSAADAAALAAASAFLEAGPAPIPVARQRGLEYATRNSILGDAVGPDEVTVGVDAARSRVSVRVERRITDTWFARLLSSRALAVSAEAVAEASTPTSASCVRPFSPIDLRPGRGNGNGNGNGAGGGNANAGGNGRGNGRSARGSGTTQSGPTGADGYSVGERIPVWSTGQNGEATFWDMPDSGGWSGSCDAPGIGGNGRGPAVRRNICMCNNTPVDTLTTYRVMNGNMTGSVRHGFDGLLDQDPGARWDVARGAVVGSAHADWRQSPRIVILPLFDPEVGGNQLRFSGFIRVFIESSGNAYFGRYVSDLRGIRLIK